MAEDTHDDAEAEAEATFLDFMWDAAGGAGEDEAAMPLWGLVIVTYMTEEGRTHWRWKVVGEGVGLGDVVGALEIVKVQEILDSQDAQE